MVVREYHRVEPPDTGAEQMIGGHVARADVGIAAAAVHEHAMLPGEQRDALALSDVERRNVQAPALELQRVEARCRKEHRHRQRAGDPPAVPPPPRDSTDGKECIDVEQPQHGKRGVEIERVERQALQQSRNKKHIPHAERHERHKGRADRRDGHAQQQAEQPRTEHKAHHPQAQEVAQERDHGERAEIVRTQRRGERQRTECRRKRGQHEAQEAALGVDGSRHLRRQPHKARHRREGEL